MYRYPRLPVTVAAGLAQEMAAMDVEAAARMARPEHEEAIYAPVGPPRAPVSHIREIGSGIRTIAAENGFPEKPSQQGARDFDMRTAIHLHEQMRISPNEASRDGAWQFISCVLAPDIVRWRFPGKPATGTASERFLGGVRNVFGRLWWRAYMLRDDTADSPHQVLEALNEDELVQLMERPTMVGDRRLTLTLAKRFLVAVEDGRSPNRMELMREVQKRLMRLFPIVCFAALPDEVLARTLQDVIAEATGPESLA